eukprot:1474947-Pleurochrysis_carterae.AAC.1
MATVALLLLTFISLATMPLGKTGVPSPPRTSLPANANLHTMSPPQSQGLPLPHPPKLAVHHPARSTPSSFKPYDFDNGYWVNFSLHDHFGDWQCPLWETKPTRFNCPNTEWRRYETPFSVPDASHALSTHGAHRTIFFVGDSLMGQSTAAFTCRVLRDAHKRNVSTMLTTIKGPPWSTLLSSPRTGACQPFCHEVSAHASSITACFVAAGINLPTCNRRASDAAAALAHHFIARRGDLIFFNEGLWHKTVQYSNKTLEAILADLSSKDGVLQSLLRTRGIGLAWRETSPQHFATQADGSYKKGWYSGKRCGPHALTARPPGQDEMLARLEAAGLPVLKIWGATESQWDQHLELKTPHTRARSGADCTHFCHPSGVMEAWVDGTLILAERMLHSLNYTW